MLYRIKCQNRSCANYFDVDSEAWDRHVKGIEYCAQYCKRCMRERLPASEGRKPEARQEKPEGSDP